MSNSTKYVATGARVLLGLIFFVFGLNGFLQFIPMPPPPPEAAAFFGALMATGYMLPLLKVTEVVAGALLLANRAVPLALVVLAPIIVNIVAFHLVLSPGIGMALVIVVLEAYLCYAHRSHLLPLLGSQQFAAESTNEASRRAHAN